ncbi:MAG: methyltransferase domain-containing protein [bacterium]
MNRNFDIDAKNWDNDEGRMRVSLAVAAAMASALEPEGGETLLDYGAGTGVIALKLSERVGNVIAADSSRGMLEVLDGKIAASGVTNIRTMFLDLVNDPYPAEGVSADIIVSSMTLHHISDTAKVISALYRILAPGGRIAVADLDSESGDFHADNTGVHHFGHDRATLKTAFANAGFRDINITTAHTLNKPASSGELKSFPIFLLAARK